MGNLGKKNPDEVAYLIDFDEEKLRVGLTLVSGEKITGEMFLQALLAFIDDYEDNPELIFKDGVETEYETH